MGAAWLLRKDHDITLFEKGLQPGGHANTVTAVTPLGPLQVDTGFMVYNEPNYPNLCGLFDALGVQSDDTDMSFAVSVNDGDYEYAGDNLATLFAQRSNLLSVRHYRMLLDILRFNKLARRALDNDSDVGSLGDFLDRHQLSSDLSQRYLLPMTAAIWSCPTETMRDFPALSLFRFLDNHGLISVNDRPQWKTPRGGSRRYVERLTGQLPDVRCNQSVAVVSREAAGVRVTTVSGESECFDGVIMASHADETLQMLGNPTEREQELLGAFAYQRNHVYLHSDISLMPARRSVWSSWNYLTEENADAEQAVSVTYWMNRLQHLPEEAPLMVSLNPLTPPAARSVYLETDYDHPVFDAGAVRAQASLHELQGGDRIWFCGSYFRYGFHEDALASAVAVARQLGAEIPWERTSKPTTRQLPQAALVSGESL